MTARIVIVSGACGTGKTSIARLLASAKRFSEGGYEVYVDGVIGPWFLAPWIKLAEEGFDIRYIVLRPDEKTTISRALERKQRDYFPLNRDDIKNIWSSLSDFGKYESNVVDTTTQTVDESIAHIQKMLQTNAFRVL